MSKISNTLIVPMEFLKEFIKNKGVKLTIVMWCGFAAYIVFYGLINPGKRTVTPAYWGSSLNWMLSHDLYSHDGVGYLYLPQSAILQIPFAIMPSVLAEAIWRIGNISFYGLSCYLVARLLVRFMPLKISFLIMSLFSMPLAFSSSRNGQINLTLAALSGIVAYTLTHKKYSLSVVVCLIGFALKPYFLVPLMLICGIFPKRCLPTAVIGLIILFLFPFLLKPPDYVWHQYQGFFKTLEVARQLGIDRDYASFFGMVKVFGINTNSSFQLISSVILALAVFCYSLYISKEKSLEESSILILMVATVFILLFSPRTENNTYCLMGSFVAYLYIRVIVMQDNLRLTHANILVLCYVAMLGSYELGKFITPDRPVWLAPLGLTVFINYSLLIIIPKIQILSLKNQKINS